MKIEIFFYLSASNAREVNKQIKILIQIQIQTQKMNITFEISGKPWTNPEISREYIQNIAVENSEIRSNCQNK